MLFSWWQATEWNEETTEEQGGAAESPAVAADDSSAQNSDKKEDNAATVTEENEWDRLLRLRSVVSLVLTLSSFSTFMCVVTSDCAGCFNIYY